jgi:Na+:H+ antiporter, NhaA family
LLDHFDRTETGDFLVLTSKGQHEAIVGLERASEEVTAPLLRLEHALHGFSAFVVMPLFAFSNAGVGLTGSPGGSVTFAVILGLAVGKPLGITGAALAAVRLRLAALPAGVSWTGLHGCAWLGGIGFTMSLFIASLAFQGTNLLDSAKLGFWAARSSRPSSERSSCAWALVLRHTPAPPYSVELVRAREIHRT